LSDSRTISIQNNVERTGWTETDLLYPQTNPDFHNHLSQFDYGIPFVNAQVERQFDQISFDQMNYGYNQVQPNHLITYAPFEIQEEEAREIFRKWKELQWFAPSDFTRVSEGRLYAFLVPYHCFTAQCHSTFTGKVGFKNVTRSYQHNTRLFQLQHSSSNYTVTEHVQWQGARVSGDAQFLNVMYCGSVIDDDVKLLDQIDDWDINRVVNTYSHHESLGPCTNWAISCDEFIAHMQKSENKRAYSVLRQANGADVVENINVDIHIPTIQRCLVYMPVYYFGYQYDGVEYKFFINGQTGKTKGTRPVGLGAIGRGFDKIASLVKPVFLNKEQKAIREDWKKMQKSKSDF
jgi:hypothetical protein